MIGNIDMSLLWFWLKKETFFEGMIKLGCHALMNFIDLEICGHIKALLVLTSSEHGWPPLLGVSAVVLFSMLQSFT